MTANILVVGFLNSSFTTTLATAGTALLSLSFVFAGTAQEVLSSCIFLFVKHPFDVLDRVDIGSDQLVVKHISLLYTVFKYVNNHKLTQVPNTVLNSLWIQNISRSEAMREQLLLYVSFDTSLEDVQLLKNEMQAFVNDKENSRDFQPDIDVEVTGIAEMNKLELKVEIRHNSNWSNETVRAARRSKFMCALVLALRKIPINAPGGGGAALGSADQPTYAVSVSDQDAAARREEFMKAQDAKRLFPTSKTSPTANKPSRGISTGADSFNPHDSATPPPLRYRQVPPSESTALNTLNSRHPAADTAHNPSDIIEHPNTPKSIANSVAGQTEMPEVDHSVSIEEVRGMLRRQSTRGKRKSPKSASYASKLAFASDANTRPLPPPSSRTEYASPRPPTADAANPPPPISTTNQSAQPSARIDLVESPSFEYDPYAYSSSLPHPSSPQIPTPTQQPPPSALRPGPQQQPQPSLLPIYSLPNPNDRSQRPPPSSPAANPTPPPKNSPPRSQPKAKPAQPPLITTTQQPISPINDTTNLSPSSPSTTTRSRSPIRNPFQITALKAQQQVGGMAMPRAIVQQQRPGSEVDGAGGRRPVPVPVPGAGNAFATAARGREGDGEAGGGGEGEDSREGAGVIPPPRGDSLAGGGGGASRGVREWEKVE